MIRIILYLLLFYVVFLYSAETASGQINSIEILNEKVKISENETKSKLPAEEKCKIKLMKIKQNIKEDTALIKCLKETKHQSQR